MKRLVSIISIFALILIAVCSFSACKSGNDDTTSTTSPVVSYQTTSASETSEAEDITVASYEVKGGTDPYVEDIF